MDKWEMLKEHVSKQRVIAENVDVPAMRLIGHVWRDVQNKMWSLEQEEKK